MRSEIRFTKSPCAVVAPLCGFFIGLTVPFSTALAQEWDVAFGASTDSSFRGISQNGGNPSLQGNVAYYGPGGWFMGLAASTVEPKPGYLNAGQLIASAGWTLAEGDIASTRIELTHHAYPWSGSRAVSAYDEVVATLALRNVLFLSVGASPNTSFSSLGEAMRKGATFSYDATLRWPLVDRFTLDAGIGYEDLHRLFRKGYVYGNAGVTLQAGKLQIDVSYIVTNRTAKSLFTDAASNRWVGNASWHF
jgi:uncharacterized protein (TIGR02001 family)